MSAIPPVSFAWVRLAIALIVLVLDDGMAEVPIAMALGAAIFDERLPAGTLLGAALILAGVSLVSFNAGRSEAR